MKSITKIMLAAGMIFQLSASLYADNWSDAFLVYGGGSNLAVAAQNVLKNKGRSGVRAVLNLAVNTLNSSPEGMAVAAWLSNKASDQLASPYSNADVQAAGQALIDAASVRSMPAPSAPAAPVVSEGWLSGWFGGSSSAADVQAVQQADAAQVAGNVDDLQAVINSGATGVELYNAYVDLAVESLQQAISAIVDPAVQKQVAARAQSKMSGIRATASANSNSRVLGKFSSKKGAKKQKNSKK